MRMWLKGTFPNKRTCTPQVVCAVFGSCVRCYRQCVLCPLLHLHTTMFQFTFNIIMLNSTLWNFFLKIFTNSYETLLFRAISVTLQQANKSYAFQKVFWRIYIIACLIPIAVQCVHEFPPICSVTHLCLPMGNHCYYSHTHHTEIHFQNKNSIPPAVAAISLHFFINEFS